MQSRDPKTPSGNGSTYPREVSSTPDVPAHEIDLGPDEEWAALMTGPRRHRGAQQRHRPTIDHDTTIREEGTPVAATPGEAHSVRAGAQSRSLLTCVLRPAPRVHNSKSALSRSRLSRAFGWFQRSEPLPRQRVGGSQA